MTRLSGYLIVALATLLAVCAPAGADVPTSYPTVAFSDGFESGALTTWSQPFDSKASIGSSGAASGTYDARLDASLTGQPEALIAAMPQPLGVTSTRFKFRSTLTSGFVTVAMARDAASSGRIWELLYDGAHGGFYFYPYDTSRSHELYTGNASAAPTHGWNDIEIRYDAASDGGAEIAVNGHTAAIGGDFSRPDNFAILQLWNDAVTTNEFDDVSVSLPSDAVTAPDAPTTITGTAGDGQVALDWSAPGQDGGRAISGYRITPYVGDAPQAPISTSGAATHAVVSGLANGTTYTFRVAAINSIGTGADSAPSGTFTPHVSLSAPAAPSTPTTVAGDGRVSLTWTAPADDGGSAITGYRIVPFIGSNAQPAIDTGATDTSATVTGLANGTAYTFKVAGLNGVGEGVYSVASAPVTPASSAPSSFVYSDDFESGSLGGYTQLNTGNGSASASPAAAHQGGYGLRLADDAGQFALAAHSLGADPLTDSSTTFWVRLTATSGMVTVAEGRSASAARAWDLIYDATHRGFYYYPYGASGSVEIFTGNNTASAPGTWMQIQLDYDATASGGAQILINGATQRAWSRTGNFAGAAGYQTLQLWNDGQGSADFDDVAVGSAAGLAAAPTGVTASPQSDGSVTVKWDAPAGGGITSYRVTPYLGTAAQTPAYSPTASANVSGLTLGSTYTFKVAAINAVGTGPDSAASAAALAATPPDAPSGITPSPGDGRVTVQWTAPANTGGSPVTGYTVTPYAGATAGTPVTVGNVSSTVVSGLVNGTAYTFRVAAVNAVGTGAQSAASASVTPAATASTVPGVLGGPVTATASGFGAAALTWKAATSDGGSPILGYRITPVIGGVGGPVQTPVDVSPTATSYTLTGLNGNTTYLIRVQAFNANGVGPANAGALVVRGGPTNVTATASDGAVTINWALPANTTSSQLTNYLVYPYIGSQRAPGLPGVWIPVTSTSMTMDGLTDGTTYNFHVEAVSSAWGNSPDSISNEATPSVWTPPATPYTNTVFTDTFESGRGNWTVLQPAAGETWRSDGVGLGKGRQGGSTHALDIYTSSSYQGVAYHTLPAPVSDSATSFWFRVYPECNTVCSPNGTSVLAQARDTATGAVPSATAGLVWSLKYNAGDRSFSLLNAAGTGIRTGANVAPLPDMYGQWVQLEVRYNASTSGSATLYVNGQTQPSWTFAGDFSRASGYQTLQFTHESLGVSDEFMFDDVSVAARG